jgi:predicted lipid-binding transport protein (Tim44 family)
MSRIPAFRTVLAVVAALTALVLVATEVDARSGRGGSFGSRGTRTYSAPPPTQTAPNTASPINRSITQPQSPTVAGAPRTAPAQQGGFFSRPGFLGGMFAGFLGAGLLGMLFGGGLFGGLSGGGFASFLGLLLQVALVVIVARLIWTWWQRRNAPAYASAGAPSMRDIGSDQARPTYGGLGGGSAMAGGDVAIGEDDYNRFERVLGEVQAAYSAEDLGKLRALVTPEMLSYFAEELADNTSRGVVNQVSDVKLLQGDLAESWREGAADYATVAMRFSLKDITTERASGRVVEGSNDPQEAVELWTFMRSRGGNWILSAIQQA